MSKSQKKNINWEDIIKASVKGNPKPKTKKKAAKKQVATKRTAK